MQLCNETVGHLDNRTGRQTGRKVILSIKETLETWEHEAIQEPYSLVQGSHL
jgi:hypothetical protein